jgi:hypothetical protein
MNHPPRQPGSAAGSLVDRKTHKAAVGYPSVIEQSIRSVRETPPETVGDPAIASAMKPAPWDAQERTTMIVAGAVFTIPGPPNAFGRGIGGRKTQY